MTYKRTKAVDITGRFIKVGDDILRYKIVPLGAKCSKCIDGLDDECTVCHGVAIEPIEPTPKWYQLKKRFEKWLR
jgi:hypothetical protein